MIHCKNCIYWIDESLEQIEADPFSGSHIFMGCRIRGSVDCNHAPQSCKYYIASENLFTICHSCKLAVPKVCVSLGECVNCTDTDLFCVDLCLGKESRKYCPHFIRLHTEGVHLIDRDRVFDLFPAIGMPSTSKTANSRINSGNMDKSRGSITTDSRTKKAPLKSQNRNSRRRTNLNSLKISKRYR
jgi:hypothetical protein